MRATDCDPGETAARVRTAREEDLPELVRLVGLLLAQEAEFAAGEGAQTEALSALMSKPDRGMVLVAERSGRALGVTTLQLVVSTALGAPVALLEDMVVDPSARGEGVGSLLLAAAIEHALDLGCRRITLLTDADNMGAHRFYERQGFVRSAMVPFRLGLDQTTVHGRS